MSKKKKKKKKLLEMEEMILCVFLRLSILHSVHMPENNHGKDHKMLRWRQNSFIIRKYKGAGGWYKNSFEEELIPFH